MTELIQLTSEFFPVPLIVEALDEDDEWEVKEDFYGIDPILGRIDVPKNTITDFGSIPKIMRGLISPTSRYRKPYLEHDRNYTQQELNGKPLTQKQSDDCLMRGMVERDMQHNKLVPWYKKKFGLERNTIYIGLRIGGFAVWEEHRKEKLARQYQEKANGQSVGTNKNP